MAVSNETPCQNGIRYDVTIESESVESNHQLLNFKGLKQKRLFNQLRLKRRFKMVPSRGIEPRTQGFSVLCSTD